MKAIRIEKGVGPRGFSRWVNPTMQRYLLACCDCGLVHEMQFQVFARGGVRKNGSYRMATLPSALFGVRFRARRAERYTAKQRAREASRG